MKTIGTIQEMKAILKGARAEGKSIGFVPTMGYLHEGHMSLIRRARLENDFVVVSIFVNPTQFGIGEDLETYPRDLERDKKMCEAEGTDVIFNPSNREMYPIDYKTYVEVGEITEVLCGASRPGHFKGVTTVISKLFNIVSPDRAYFGQKDAQQVAVIRQLVRDLNFDIEIIPCPIIREHDGLAMSSRNTYLSTEQRKAALILSKSLFSAKEMIEDGTRSATEVIDFITGNIQSEPLAAVDYVEIVDGKTLEKVIYIKGDILIAIAVKIGTVRLIDNLHLEV